MKIKVEDIFMLVDGLNELNKKELPVSLSLKLQRNSLKINDEVDLITKMKKEILNKYKELEENDKSEDSNYYDIATEELEDLDSQEIDIDLQVVSTKELEECGAMIKPMTLMQLNTIITEEEED